MRVRGTADRQQQPISPALVAAVRPENEINLSEEDLLDLVASGEASAEEVMALGALLERSAVLADLAPPPPSDQTLGATAGALAAEGASADEAAEIVADKKVQQILAKGDQARAELERAMQTAEERKSARHGKYRGQEAPTVDPAALQDALQKVLAFVGDGAQSLAELSDRQLNAALIGLDLATGGIVKTVLKDLGMTALEAATDINMEDVIGKLATQMVAYAYNTTVEGLKEIDPELVSQAMLGAQTIGAIIGLKRSKAGKVIKNFAAKAKKRKGKKPGLNKVDTPDSVQPPKTQAMKKADGPDAPQLQKPPLQVTQRTGMKGAQRVDDVVDDVPVRSPNLTARPPMQRPGQRVPQTQTRLTRTRSSEQARPSSRLSGSGGSVTNNRIGRDQLLEGVKQFAKDGAQSSFLSTGTEALILGAEGKLGTGEGAARLLASGGLGLVGGGLSKRINNLYPDHIGKKVVYNGILGGGTGAIGGGIGGALASDKTFAEGAVAGFMGGLEAGVTGSLIGEASDGLGLLFGRFWPEVGKFARNAGQGIAANVGNSGSFLANTWDVNIR